MPPNNKKVKNAVTIVKDGIEFKSVLESRVYSKLLSYGITPEYEPEKIVLLNGFRTKHDWFSESRKGIIKRRVAQEVTYTPDFKFTLNNRTIYLEVKGFITDRYPLKRKMFVNYLNSIDSDVAFIEIKTIGGLVNILSRLNPTERL